MKRLHPWDVWWFWQVFIRNFNNGKLNFCSAGMSQEAFLPHINRVAARHFWKRKQQWSHTVWSWKHVVTMDRGQIGKLQKVTWVSMRETCQHIVNISGWAHLKMQEWDVDHVVPILLNRHGNSKFYPHLLC